MNKDYKQNFDREIGAHETPVITNTAPAKKRSDIDQIGNPETDWESIVKEYLVYHKPTNTLECGVNFEVDGKLSVNDETQFNDDVKVGTSTSKSDLVVEGNLEVNEQDDGHGGYVGGDIHVGHELVIDDLQKVVDPNGEAIIPDPSGYLRHALGHSSTGYTWYKGYELAGFEVVKKSVFEGEGYVYQTHKVYFVWNDTEGADYGTVYVRYYEA